MLSINMPHTLLLFLLISGSRAGWSTAPQAAAAFVAAPAPSSFYLSNLNRAPTQQSSLCAFESEEEKGDGLSTKDSSSAGDVGGFSLFYSVAAWVGTTLFAAVASALRKNDNENSSNNASSGYGTIINRRKSMQNMANTAFSITAGNLALDGITAAGRIAAASGGAAAAAAGIYERTLSLGGSAVASEELLAWIASQKAVAATPEIMAWMAAQKRLQLLRGVGTAVTGVVTRAGLGKPLGAAKEVEEAVAATSSAAAAAEEISLTGAVVATTVVSKAFSVNDEEQLTNDMEVTDEEIDTLRKNELQEGEVLAQGESQQADKDNSTEQL